MEEPSICSLCGLAPETLPRLLAPAPTPLAGNLRCSLRARLEVKPHIGVLLVHLGAIASTLGVVGQTDR